MAARQAEPVALLRELVRLNFETIRAYQAAIRLSPATLRPRLAALMADHEVQARRLAAETARAGAHPPTARDVRGELAARVEGAQGEADVLGRLADIEEEVARAYAQAASEAAPDLPLAATLQEFQSMCRRGRNTLMAAQGGNP